MIVWDNTPFMIAAMFSGFLASILGLVALRYRSEKGSLTFSALMFSVTWWCVSYGVELGTGNTVWKKAKYIGILGVVSAWIIFVLKYTGRDRWLTKPFFGVLIGAASVILGLIWTNDIHWFFWSGEKVVSNEILTINYFKAGPGFWIHSTYSYILVVGGSLLLIQRLFGSANLYKGQMVALLITAVAPLISNLLTLSGLNPLYPLDLTPFAFTISGLAMAWAFFKFKLLDIVPVARDAIIEEMEEGVVVVDDEGRVVDINPEAQKIVKKSEDNAVGRKIEEVFSDYSDITELIKNPSEKSEETVIQDEDNNRFYSARVSSLSASRNEMMGKILLFRDITEQKEREEKMRQKNEKLEILNRIVRHDIRNDMNVVLGRGELLREGVAPEYEEHLETIIENSQHTVELTETVRELMEAITGDEELELEKTHLRSTIEKEIEKVRTTYEEAEFIIEEDIPDVYVEANKMLSSVFSNLFNNAIQHNDKEDPRVEIDFEEYEKEILVRVADNGPGIPEERKEEIFGRGEKGIESAGTGIGLYLVDTLVDQYGGTVEVENLEPEGAAFELTLMKS